MQGTEIDGAIYSIESQQYVWDWQATAEQLCARGNTMLRLPEFAQDALDPPSCRQLPTAAVLERAVKRTPRAVVARVGPESPLLEP